MHSSVPLCSASASACFFARVLGANTRLVVGIGHSNGARSARGLPRACRKPLPSSKSYEVEGGSTGMWMAHLW